MSLFDFKAFLEKAKADPEFTRETRYLNGALKIVLADETWVLHFASGKIARVSEDDTPDADCRIIVRGDLDHWTNILAEKPKPFYQCLQSTAVKHGLQLSDTNETFAYLPALNRMTTLMRRAYNQGTGA